VSAFRSLFGAWLAGGEGAAILKDVLGAMLSLSPLAGQIILLRRLANFLCVEITKLNSVKYGRCVL
jgi:hypothetical protein